MAPVRPTQESMKFFKYDEQMAYMRCYTSYARERVLRDAATKCRRDMKKAIQFHRKLLRKAQKKLDAQKVVTREENHEFKLLRRRLRIHWTREQKRQQKERCEEETKNMAQQLENELENDFLQ